MKLDQKVKASMVVIECGHELYHLECARREAGDKKVLDYLCNFFQEKDGQSPADAYISAGQVLKTVDRLKNREFGFQGMRQDFAQQMKAEQQGYAPHPGLLPA